MLVVTSPAKRLDWDPVEATLTQPDLQDEAVKLVKTARNLTLGIYRGGRRPIDSGNAPTS